MKAVVLCAGKGTRLYPVTLTMPKPLVPVANKPLLEYAIDFLKNLGATEIGLVVNSVESPISERFGDGRETVGVPLTYIAQENPRGLAHAVKLCQPFIGDEPFVVYLGDNLFQDSMKMLVDQFQAQNAAAAIALTEVANPSAFGVAELEGDRIKRLVEKPKEPKSNLAIAGVYAFQPTIFDAIDHIEPSWRNEYEITDAIQYLLDHDQVVLPYVAEGYWIDAGKPEAIMRANQIILEQTPYCENTSDDGRIQGDSHISHRVFIGENAQIIDSVVRGPAVIGNNVTLRNAYIGPYTALGDNVTVEDSEIENSIVMGNSTIQNVPGRIDASLLASNTRVVRTMSKPMTHRLVLAENSQVEIS